MWAERCSTRPAFQGPWGYSGCKANPDVMRKEHGSSVSAHRKGQGVNPPLHLTRQRLLDVIYATGGNWSNAQ